MQKAAVSFCHGYQIFGSLNHFHSIPPFRSYHNQVQPKIDWDQKVLNELRGYLCSERAYREDPATSKEEPKKRDADLKSLKGMTGLTDPKALEGAIKLTEQRIQKTLEQSPNKEIKAERDAAEQGLDAAREEFNAANQRMDRLETNWRDSQQSSVPMR